MRNVYDVLREKEYAIERLRREVEALRSVTPLLADARSNIPQSATCTEARLEMASELGEALRAVAPLLVDDALDLDPEIRARLVEATERESRLGRTAKILHQLRHKARGF